MSAEVSEAKMFRLLLPYIACAFAAGGGGFGLGVATDGKQQPIDMQAIAAAAASASAVQAENAVLKVQAAMNTTLGGLVAKVDALQSMTNQVNEQSRAIVYLQRAQEQCEAKNHEQDERLERLEGRPQ